MHLLFVIVCASHLLASFCSLHINCYFLHYDQWIIHFICRSKWKCDCFRSKLQSALCSKWIHLWITCRTWFSLLYQCMTTILDWFTYISICLPTRKYISGICLSKPILAYWDFRNSLNVMFLWNFLCVFFWVLYTYILKQNLEQHTHNVKLDVSPYKNWVV